MLRAPTAALRAEVDVRFSGPFETDKNGNASLFTPLARTVPPLELPLEQGSVGNQAYG